MEHFRGEASPWEICRKIDKRNKEHIAGHDVGQQDNTIPFGWFWLVDRATSGSISEKQFVVGNPNQDHNNIDERFIEEWGRENGLPLKKAEEKIKCERAYCGRIFPKEKIVSFFTSNTGYPSIPVMKDIFKKLEEKTGLNFDRSYTIYLEDFYDPRSETKEDFYINSYSVPEFLTGIDPDEKPADVQGRRNAYDNDTAINAGIEKYRHAVENDPHLDRMYSHFVAEGKKKKIIMTESQARFLFNKIKKGL